jgi:4a-hydroxytetrahydrobiopterin dehydratase
MNADLADKKCVEAGARAARLTEKEIRALKKQLSGWQLTKGKSLEKHFQFPDFKQALQYTNQIGKLAEKSGHHPDILLTYGAVQIQISTHSVKGLTENDFILAAKIDRLK